MRRNTRRAWRRAAVLASAVIVLWGAWLSVEAYHRRSIEARLALYDPLIRAEAERTGLSRELIRSVVRAESGGDAGAVSGRQAVGLMQVRADAESDALRILGQAKGDLFDPAYNLRVGTTYLKRMSDRFSGDPYLAVAAYHMGPTRLQEVLNDNPGLSGREIVEVHANPTTRAYVLRVIAGR